MSCCRNSAWRGDPRPRRSLIRGAEDDGFSGGMSPAGCSEVDDWSGFGGSEVSFQYVDICSRCLKNAYALPNRTALSPAGVGRRRTVRKAGALSTDSSFRRSMYVLMPGDSLPLLRVFLLSSSLSSTSSGEQVSHSSDGGRKAGSGIRSRVPALDITWTPTASKCPSWISVGLQIVCNNFAKGAFPCGNDAGLSGDCGAHVGN